MGLENPCKIADYGFLREFQVSLRWRVGGTSGVVTGAEKFEIFFWGKLFWTQLNLKK